MSVILDGTGAPRHFGYVKCTYCGCHRPKASLVEHYEGVFVCTDSNFCTRAAGVGLGKLDVEAKP